MTEREHTDLAALQDLAAAAIGADIQETAQREAEADAEIVELARGYARSVLGDAAADALGVWLPVDQALCPEDTAQAGVQLAPGVHLVFNLHAEKQPFLSVSADCRRCHHHRETRVYSLLSLASALQRQGLR